MKKMSSFIRELSDTEVASMSEAGVWNENCPVHYSRLKVVTVPFLDFNNKSESSELVVLDIVAEKARFLFQELFEFGFQIEKIIPIVEFGGNDVESMKANNSSAFNGRKVANTDLWSSHAFGVAIDVNPIQNPYLKLKDKGVIEVIPADGITYVNRSVQKKGMVEGIVSIFAKYGFTEWGGNWELKPDYHHFQLPWNEINLLFPDRMV